MYAALPKYHTFYEFFGLLSDDYEVISLSQEDCERHAKAIATIGGYCDMISVITKEWSDQAQYREARRFKSGQLYVRYRVRSKVDCSERYGSWNELMLLFNDRDELKAYTLIYGKGVSDKQVKCRKIKSCASDSVEADSIGYGRDHAYDKVKLLGSGEELIIVNPLYDAENLRIRKYPNCNAYELKWSQHDIAWTFVKSGLALQELKKYIDTFEIRGMIGLQEMEDWQLVTLTTKEVAEWELRHFAGRSDYDQMQ